MEYSVDSTLKRRSWNQNLWRSLGLEKNRKVLMWCHWWWRRCVELCSHLWVPCILSSRLCCWCILLRSHRLSSRCIKLCSGWWSQEFRRHAKSSSWIPSPWESRCRSSLYRCRNQWWSWVNRIWLKWWCHGSGLHWSLTITCFWMAIWSRQSCRYSRFYGSKIIWFGCI